LCAKEDVFFPEYIAHQCSRFAKALASCLFGVMFSFLADCSPSVPAKVSPGYHAQAPVLWLDPPDNYRLRKLMAPSPPAAPIELKTSQGLCLTTYAFLGSCFCSPEGCISSPLVEDVFLPFFDTMPSLHKRSFVALRSSRGIPPSSPHSTPPVMLNTVFTCYLDAFLFSSGWQGFSSGHLQRPCE